MIHIVAKDGLLMITAAHHMVNRPGIVDPNLPEHGWDGGERRKVSQFSHSRTDPFPADKPVVAVRAKVEIAGKVEELTVQPGSNGVVFEMNLPTGPTELSTYLFDGNGKAGGAYFTEVERL